MKKYAIAVDLGGTNIRAAVIDATGDIAQRISRPSLAGKGKDTVITVLLAALEEASRWCPEGTVTGIGLAVAGAIDMRSGVVTQSPNFTGWDNIPLRDIIQRRLSRSLPVFLENDANAAALGERWKGAGRGGDNIVCLTLGTGIGGGVIADGMLLHGADGMAAELGHITVDPGGPYCNCGNAGCLEALASATAIRREAIAALRDGNRRNGLMMKLCRGNVEELTAAMVSQAAQSGDKLAQIVYQTMGRFLGIGIATLINIFNPEKVIIGGQVSKAWDLFVPFTKEEVRTRALRVPGQRAEIVPAQQGDDAGLLGAAHLVFEALSPTPSARS